MKRILSGWFVLVLGVGLACGHTNYYMVKDPGTGKTYYTEKLSKEASGAVTLTDAKTSSTVTIQNSEVTEISQQTYQQGLAAPAAPAAPAPNAAPPAAPAPAPATTPAAAPAK